MINLSFISRPEQHCQYDFPSCLHHTHTHTHPTSLWTLLLQCFVDSPQLLKLFTLTLLSQILLFHILPSQQIPIYLSTRAQISTFSGRGSCPSHCSLFITLSTSNFKFIQESTLFIIISPALTTPCI